MRSCGLFAVTAEDSARNRTTAVMRAALIPAAGIYRMVACIPTLQHTDCEHVSVFRLINCWSSLTRKAECTTLTSCKFSYGTQLTGIFSALWFMLPVIHTQGRCYPLLSLFMLNFTSLFDQSRMKMRDEQQCHDRAVQSSEVSAEAITVAGAAGAMGE